MGSWLASLADFCGAAGSSDDAVLACLSGRSDLPLKAVHIHGVAQTLPGRHSARCRQEARVAFWRRIKLQTVL